MRSRNSLLIKKLVLIGMLAATITGGKLALLGVHNVEIVTLLIMVYTAVFGLSVALPVTLIFVSVELLIIEINTWVLSYYIHWCALAVFTAIVRRTAKDKYIFYPLIALVMTAAFGVLTSLIDSLIAAGYTDESFFKIFAAVYIRGIYFYIVHTVSNTIIVALGFLPLKTLLTRLKRQYLGIDDKIV